MKAALEAIIPLLEPTTSKRRHHNLPYEYILFQYQTRVAFKAFSALSTMSVDLFD